MHVVARCNNREFCFAAPEDFEILLDHLGEMSSAYEVRLFAYTLMSNHIHLLLQSPAAWKKGTLIQVQLFPWLNRRRGGNGAADVPLFH